MSAIKKIDYWQLEKEVLISQFHTSENGLEDNEAAGRLVQYGLNEIPFGKPSNFPKHTFSLIQGSSGLCAHFCFSFSWFCILVTL